MGRPLLTPTEVALDYLAAFSTGDPDEIAALVAPGFANEHTSALGDGCTGRDEYRRRLPGFLAMFEGLRYDIVDTVADGSTVAVSYVLRAVHRGHDVTVPGTQWFEIDDDGLIARRVDYWDSLGFLRQIGEA